MIVRDRDKGSNNMNWAQHGSSPWTDERFHYLHLSIQIVTVVSLICATSEIVFGCWSLNILSSRIYGSNNSNQDRDQINPSTKSKHMVIGAALFLGLGARIAALLFWIRSTRNENLRCYSVTSHCTFVSLFVSLGLGCLLLYFVTVSFDSNIGGFRPNTEVLLSFVYISGFDILFTSTFGFAVASDLQSKIRNEWRSELSLSVCPPQAESWMRPRRVSKLEKSVVTEILLMEEHAKSVFRGTELMTSERKLQQIKKLVDCEEIDRQTLDRQITTDGYSYAGVFFDNSLMVDRTIAIIRLGFLGPENLSSASYKANIKIEEVRRLNEKVVLSLSKHNLIGYQGKIFYVKFEEPIILDPSLAKKFIISFKLDGPKTLDLDPFTLTRQACVDGVNFYFWIGSQQMPEIQFKKLQ